MKEAEKRSGGDVVQPAGYKAFIPKPLPPVPPLLIDAELQHLLYAGDRSLGRLDGSIHTLPDPDHFISMYVRKEAVLESRREPTERPEPTKCFAVPP